MSDISTGYEELWCWFGLSRASFLTLPRVLMHEMPDEWQRKMAALLDEYDHSFYLSALPNTTVRGTKNGKLVRFPEWILNYRHPDMTEIDKIRTNPRLRRENE